MIFFPMPALTHKHNLSQLFFAFAFPFPVLSATPKSSKSETLSVCHSPSLTQK